MDDFIYDPYQFEDIIPDYGTPRLPSRSATPASQSRGQSQDINPGFRLPLLQLSDWDETREYNDHPPTCIHYSLQWEIRVNTGSRTRKLTFKPEQEPDLTLAPSAYWTRSLKSKVEERVIRKTGPNEGFDPEETNIVVSVSDRAIKDFAISATELNIEWEKIEQQLKSWSRFFYCGKKLQVHITFIYKPRSIPKRAAGKKGATGRQYTQIAIEDEEHEATGQVSHWNKVYAIMRCAGSKEPCTGRQCFDDADLNRHISVDGETMQELVTYSEDGNKFDEQKDVPPHIRDLIYKKDRNEKLRKEDKKRKRATSPSANYPVQIILPNTSNPNPNESGVGLNTRDNNRPVPHAVEWNIPEPRDDAIKRYCIWHCGRVNCEEWKESFRSASTITLRQGLDLKDIYQDKLVDIYIKEGVLLGIARSWVNDVRRWVDELNKGIEV